MLVNILGLDRGGDNNYNILLFFINVIYKIICSLTKCNNKL